MRYSVTDDKRNAIECVLYLISCIICVTLEVFLLNKIVINDPTLHVLWILFQCAVSISPVFIVWAIKKFLCNFLLKICNIKNLSGTYIVEIQSNYKKGTTSHAKLEIVQTFDKIQICFIADNSKSCAINAKIENTNIHPELCYSYKNEGNGVDKNNKTHIGTAVLTFIEDKIDGFYYNNGKDRSTYGTIKSLE